MCRCDPGYAETNAGFCDGKLFTNVTLLLLNTVFDLTVVDIYWFSHSLYNRRILMLCSDIDECSQEGKDQECQDKNADCVNTNGGYRCECQSGYTMRNGVCDGTREP